MRLRAFSHLRSLVAWPSRYQGESNSNPAKSPGPSLYACRFPAMITAWRKAFKLPDAYFGFVQLSTWCPPPEARVPEMRQTQLEAVQRAGGKIGFATNADYGAGCNVHPPAKQHCGYRLGDSALALVYGQERPWQSPMFVSQTFSASPQPMAVVTVRNTSTAGLDAGTFPHNYLGGGDHGFHCKSEKGMCAWAALKLASGVWVNATVTVSAPNQVTLTAPQMDRSAGGAEAALALPVASAYGWGNIPMMNVYDRGTNLPLLPFNSSFVPY